MIDTTSHCKFCGEEVHMDDYGWGMAIDNDTFEIYTYHTEHLQMYEGVKI